MHCKRICIIGNSGSGKSTLSKKLGEVLGVPVFHLDRHLLTNNFEKLPAEEQERVHTELIAQENWVIDGNYRNTLEDRIARATLVVFLDISRVVTVPRLFKRTRKTGQLPDTVPDGANMQGISWEFFKWTAGYNRRKKIQEIRRYCEKYSVPLLLLPNTHQANWLSAILGYLQSA